MKSDGSFSIYVWEFPRSTISHQQSVFSSQKAVSPNSRLTSSRQQPDFPVSRFGTHARLILVSTLSRQQSQLLVVRLGTRVRLVLSHQQSELLTSRLRTQFFLILLSSHLLGFRDFRCLLSLEP